MKLSCVCLMFAYRKKIAYTGCPAKLFPLCYLLFYWLLLMLIAKVQEIFYAIGTRILKIDIEIVDIIEVKVSYFSASV